MEALAHRWRRAGAARTATIDWADKNLTRVVLPSLPALRRGQGQTVDYQNWLVVMRPVRATHASCLGCHARRAKRGDTLGVMVYAVDKNRQDRRPELLLAPKGDLGRV